MVLHMCLMLWAVVARIGFSLAELKIVKIRNPSEYFAFPKNT
jgi:hypothetical protein